MSAFKWAFIVVIAFPAAEIVVFILVALTIGWLWTIGLSLATSAVGLLVLRQSGRASLNRFAAALAQDGVRAIHLESPGLAAVMGGILLVLPGFITDMLGASLFVAPLRRWTGARIGRAIRKRRRGPQSPAIIDLPPDQWGEVPETPIEDRRNGQKRP